MEGMDAARLKFPGFDGNNESKFMSYAQYMRRHRKWTFLDLASADFNSHHSTGDTYRHMLAQWRQSKDPFGLSAADVVRILG